MKFDPILEQSRQNHGKFKSSPGDRFGYFFLRYKIFDLVVIADDGALCGWEHVSVSLKHRTPNWAEMCFVKNLFWDETETVVQFHPKKSEYVNCHPYVLHLWRKVGQEHELPPSILVGPKEKEKNGI